MIMSFAQWIRKHAWNAVKVVGNVMLAPLLAGCKCFARGIPTCPQPIAAVLKELLRSSAALVFELLRCYRA